jgi:hypothetical protein
VSDSTLNCYLRFNRAVTSKINTPTEFQAPIHALQSCFKRLK